MKDYSREALLAKAREKCKLTKESEKSAIEKGAQQIVEDPDHPLWAIIDEQIEEGYAILQFDRLSVYEKYALLIAGTIEDIKNIAYINDNYYVNLENKYFDSYHHCWFPYFNRGGKR